MNRATLSAEHAWYDKIIDRLGRLLERDKMVVEALNLYVASPVAPAQKRRAHLLIKSGRRDEAVLVLRAVRDQPCHAEKAYRLFLARLERSIQHREARDFELASGSLILDYGNDQVEAAVLAHYRGQGWSGLSSENWLWNAAFGLLFRDIIYDPARAVFHSPLQEAPSDL